MTPAEPNFPSYPISALYLYPVYSSQATYQQMTGKTAPFTENKPIKLWARPLGAGEDPEDYAIFNCVKQTTDNQSVKAATFPMTFGDAAVVNIPPDASGQGASTLSPSPGSTASGASTPIPIRALLPNEKLVASPFGTSVQRTDLQPAPAPTADSATLQGIADGIAAIRAKLQC